MNFKEVVSYRPNVMISHALKLWINNTNKMQLQAVYNVRSKRIEKIHHEYTNQRIAGEVMLVLDKVAVRARSITR